MRSTSNFTLFSIQTSLMHCTLYHFSAGEVIAFRFDSFLPEENYTTNATIQRHPENNEVVDDIKNAIIDMINFQSEKDETVKIQTLFAEVRLNELDQEQTSSVEKNSTGVRINGFAQLSTGSSMTISVV